MSSHKAKSKAEKEREKQVQDRLQLLLTRMLKDDDNKYCVDCDAKGQLMWHLMHLSWQSFGTSAGTPNPPYVLVLKAYKKYT